MLPSARHLILVGVLAAPAAAAGDGGLRLGVAPPALFAERAPQLSGAGSLQRCRRDAPLVVPLSDRVQRAELELSHMDYAAAETELRGADAQLVCAQAPIPPQLARQVPYLRALAAWYQGDIDGARAGFRAALALEPDMAWDTAYGPEPGAVFEEERVALLDAGALRVQLLPAPGAQSVWVDGYERTAPDGVLELLPGRHYVQLYADGWETVVISLQPGEGGHQLFLPLLGTDERQDWMIGGAPRPDLPVGLAAALPAQTRVYASSGELRWQGQVGVEGWTPLDTQPLEPAGWPSQLAYGGAGVLAAGAAVAVFGLAQRQAAHSAAASASSEQDYGAAIGQFSSGQRTAWVGAGTAAAGASMIGAGIVIGRRLDRAVSEAPAGP